MLNRRIPTIIVPMDVDSLNALYEQREDEGEYLTLAISREDLELLFRIGFFDDINETIGTLIDEYEEVELSDKHLIQRLIKWLASYTWLENHTWLENQLCRFYSYKLVILLRKAIKYNVPVFFYF
jgi:hypothetical protein